MNKYKPNDIKLLLNDVIGVQAKNAVNSFLTDKIKTYLSELSSLDKKSKKYKIPPQYIMKNFFCKTNNILSRGNKLEKRLHNKFITNRVKSIFRGLVGHHVYKSRISRRGYIKPLGYPGDYKVIEWVYNNKPISHGLGYYADAYMLNDAYIKAVIARKNYMRDILKMFIEKENYGVSEKLKILNLACGSSRELRELLKNFPSESNISVTLVDQEREALEYSRKKIEANCSGANIEYNYMRFNIISLISENRNSEIYKKLNHQNIVYSIGLVDYMPDAYFAKFINFSFSILKKKSILIFAHKNVVKHTSLASDWICDWKFISRSKSRVFEIVKKSLKGYNYRMKVKNIDDGHIYFITLTKR